MLLLKFAAGWLPGHKPDWATQVAAYAIGLVATFWTIERIAGFWQ
jgi:hypothetical protein